MRSPKLLRACASQFVAGSLLTLLVAACSPAEHMAAATFSGPGGIALAGSKFDALFVTSTTQDALQIVRLVSPIAQVDSVNGDARYFPLSIPVGPNPTEIAASADGAFVFVLDSVGDQLQLVDADALARVRTADGRVLTFDLSPVGAAPTALLGAVGSCAPSEAAPTSDCVGRVYVALWDAQGEAKGQIAVVDVRRSKSDKTLSMQLDRQLIVGGAPLRMASDASGEVLFVTDAQAPELIRLDLQADPNTAVTRIAIGAVGGPVTVSSDNTFVVVGRPTQQDVLVLASASQSVSMGELRVQPANAVWTPTPVCLQPCGVSDPNDCVGALEADAALCLNKASLVADADKPYAGLYVGGVPTQLASLGPDAAQRLVAASCEAPNQSRKQLGFGQVVAAAQLDGTLRLIGLRNASGAAELSLLDSGFCQAPRITRYPNQTQPLDTVLAGCADVAPGIARLSCVGEPDKPGTLTVLRGQAHGQSWGLVWEGAVVGSPASFVGAKLSDAGHLVVPKSQTAAAQITTQREPSAMASMRRGDIVQVLTAPALRDAACIQSLGAAPSACQLERRIVELTHSADDVSSTLVLDRPLPLACFRDTLSFRILAGDAFVVAPVDQTGTAQPSVARLYPGDIFCSASAGEPSLRFSFTILPALYAASEADACTRYDLRAAAPHPSAGLVRGQLLAWAVEDPFAPQAIAEQVDALGRAAGPVGRLPQGMLSTRSARASSQSSSAFDYLCISYGGSDGVLVLDPYDVPSAENRDTTSRLLQ